MQAIIPITDIARQKAAGLPFETVDSARWAFRQRHENGLDEAFVRIGKRIYIDAGRFFELVRRGRAA